MVLIDVECCASSDADECYHTTVEYGPCMTDESFRDSGCKYRTFTKDYKINKKGTKEEDVFIDNNTKKHHQKEYSQWLPVQTLKDQREEWRPCEYFDQLNMALASSHSIFNYSIFLSLLPHKKSLPERELLVLDEGHLLETEIVKYRGLTISKRRWRRYIHDLKMVDYGYDDIERWIDFLIQLETKMLTLTGNSDLIESFSIERKVKYNYNEEENIVVKRHEEGNSLPLIYLIATKKLHKNMILPKHQGSGSNLGDELAVDAIRDTERLTRTINNILANPKNWIVSEIIQRKLRGCEG